MVKHVLKPKAAPTVFPAHPKHKQPPPAKKRRELLKQEPPAKRQRTAQDLNDRILREHTYCETTSAEENLKNTKAKLKKTQEEVRVLKQNVKRKAKKIGNLIEEMQKLKLLTEQQVNLLDHNFGDETKALIENELKYIKSQSGHRYSEEVKKFAVTVHFYSPQAYNYIRDHLHLPHPATIRKWCASINCQPGVLTDALESLKEKMKEKDINKHCCLMLDSMAIKKEVVFNTKTKAYEGFVDCGRIETSSGDTLATEALVFMVVGLAGHYKLPVAYYMTDHLPGEIQAEMVNQLLHALHEIGMTVHAVVCDGSYANQATAKSLGCSLYPGQMRPYFSNPASPQDKVFFIFDACHMIKLVRNCFASCGKLYQGAHVINWDYIQRLQELQKKDTIRLAPKLKQKHILWEHHKMNVKLAVQTLSTSVADAIDFLREDLHHPDFMGSEETTRFIRKLDKLFDLLNSKNPATKGFKHPFRMINLENRRGWLLELISYMETLQDDKRQRLCTGKRKTPWVGFMATITSVLGLCDKLLQSGQLSYLCTYRLSQDHLEMFFSRVRRRSGWNNNPNTLQFRWALRAIFLKNGVKPSPNANAVQATDQPENLLFRRVPTKAAIQLDKDMEKYLQLLSSRSEYHDHVLNYIAGYITRTLVNDCSCTQCIIALQRGSSAACPSSELTIRKDRGGLVKPTLDVFYIVQAADKVVT